MTKRQARYKVGDIIGNAQSQFRVYQVHMGGMGEVYLCLHEQNKLPFALKTFQGTSPTLRGLFEREVKTWVDLGKHPNIVRCHWMDIFNNTPFMVLDWIAGDEFRGTDLRGWLRYGALDLKQALKFAIDIVRGLVYAGEKSDKPIVHRDLKPDNVLVAQGGLAKITDFGLATIIEEAGLTSDVDDNADFDAGKSRYAGNIVGTPAYMPPEQWRGDADIDPRADMYAVGCILYEMLTGKRVYPANTISQLRLQHTEAPIPTVADVPSEVNTIVTTCMAKNRADRYPTMTALLETLTRFYEAHTGEPILPLQAEEMTAVDYSNRGVTYANLKLYDLAIADYDEAICLDPMDAKAYANRGNSYGAIGAQEQAIADFDEAIRLDPKFAGAYSNRGGVYVKLGQNERAIADYDEAIRLDPTFAPAYYNRGGVYNKLGQNERAIADYDEAIRLDPMDAKAYYNRGVSYADLGQNERAIADYDEAIRLDPKDATAYSNRGNSYVALGQNERAIADYIEAIRLDPKDAIAYYNCGASYVALGQNERAIADFDEAIRLDPTFAPAYSNRGGVYDKLGQYKRAIADYDEAIRLDPTFAPAYSNRGGVYDKLGQNERAIADFDEAIRLDPKLATAYYTRGNSYGALGAHERAIADYTEAIRLDPTDAKVYYNRGVVYGQLGENERAITDFDEAIRLDPTDAKVYYNRGVVYGQLGENERAIADFDEAIRLDPNFTQAWFNKGAVYGNTGRLQEALACFERAYQLGFTQALGAIQQVKQMLGMAPPPPPQNDPQVAFEAFQDATSLDAMRQTVAQYPILIEMIQGIHQVIQTQIPPQLKPEFENRLVWLIQIAKGE